MTTTDTARLRELLGAATKGPWEADGAQVESESVGIICARRPGHEYPNSQAQWEANRDWIAAIHNAAPALLDELDALRRADDDLERDSATVMHMLREALGTRDVHGDIEGIDRLAKEVKALRARVAELEAELSQCRQAIGLLTTTTPEVEMNGADPVAMAMKMVDSLADRDARMRKEGAAEWLEKFAADNQERYGTYFVETTTDSLLAEAARLREGGEGWRSSWR